MRNDAAAPGRVASSPPRKPVGYAATPTSDASARRRRVTAGVWAGCDNA